MLITCIPNMLINDVCVCSRRPQRSIVYSPSPRLFVYTHNVVGHCVFRPVAWAWDLPHREPCWQWQSWCAMLVRHHWWAIEGPIGDVSSPGYRCWVAYMYDESELWQNSQYGPPHGDRQGNMIALYINRVWSYLIFLLLYINTCLMNICRFSYS